LHPNLLSTVIGSASFDLLSLDCLAGMVMVWATARVVRAPKNWFFLGFVSKVTWLIVSLWFTLQIGGLLLPLGAIVALWHMRALARRHAGDQASDLPFATGSPVKNESGR
jgi:hypothetical protein